MHVRQPNRGEVHAFNQRTWTAALEGHGGERLWRSSQGIAKNPLGIIALFIVSVYGFAALVMTFAGSFPQVSSPSSCRGLMHGPVAPSGVARFSRGELRAVEWLGRTSRTAADMRRRLAMPSHELASGSLPLGRSRDRMTGVLRQAQGQTPTLLHLPLSSTSTNSDLVPSRRRTRFSTSSCLSTVSPVHRSCPHLSSPLSQSTSSAKSIGPRDRRARITWTVIGSIDTPLARNCRTSLNVEMRMPVTAAISYEDEVDRVKNPAPAAACTPAQTASSSLRSSSRMTRWDFRPIRGKTASRDLPADGACAGGRTEIESSVTSTSSCMIRIASRISASLIC